MHEMHIGMQDEIKRETVAFRFLKTLLAALKPLALRLEKARGKAEERRGKFLLLSGLSDTEKRLFHPFGAAFMRLTSI